MNDKKDRYLNVHGIKSNKHKSLSSSCSWEILLAMVETGVKDDETAPISPYTLAASDNLGAVITNVQLSGDNYNEWSSEMLNALQAKRKIGFINGSLKKPDEGSSDLENWLVVNSMIVGWIRTSIQPKVRSTVTYISDAHQLWSNLKERFSVGNTVRIHQIKAQLASCRQEGQSVLD